MSDLRLEELVFDWNAQTDLARPRRVELCDETLRDGLQSPSIQNPPLEVKLKALHYMAELGIESANIGMPCTGPNAFAHSLALAKEIARQRLPIRANCAARTVRSDVEPIVEISQQAGIPIEASTFLGSSAIRALAEGWDLNVLLAHTEQAVSFAVQRGLLSMYVTEDTTRSHPDTLAKLYRTAIDAGARALVLADTVGHADPHGVRGLVRFVKERILKPDEPVRIDWHGHNDRGLAVANSLAAFESGAHCVHGTILGVGERVGNAPLDQLLVNLRLLQWINRDLHSLNDYCQLVHEHCGAPLPFNYPVMGRDAFRTSTGVHASAIAKAQERGAAWLANRIYSGVPSDWFGRSQTIEIGPMSGRSNVIYWLRQRGLEAQEPLVNGLLEQAKRARSVLSEVQVRQFIANHHGGEKHA